MNNNNIESEEEEESPVVLYYKQKYGKINAIPDYSVCEHIEEPPNNFKLKNRMKRSLRTWYLTMNISFLFVPNEQHELRFDKPHCEKCALIRAESWLSEPFTKEHFDLVKDSYSFPIKYEEAIKAFKCRGDCLLKHVKFAEAESDNYGNYYMIMCKCGKLMNCKCKRDPDAEEKEFLLLLEQAQQELNIDDIDSLKFGVTI